MRQASLSPGVSLNPHQAPVPSSYALLLSAFKVCNLIPRCLSWFVGLALTKATHTLTCSLTESGVPLPGQLPAPNALLITRVWFHKPPPPLTSYRQQLCALQRTRLAVDLAQCPQYTGTCTHTCGFQQEPCYIHAWDQHAKDQYCGQNSPLL